MNREVLTDQKLQSLFEKAYNKASTIPGFLPKHEAKTLFFAASQVQTWIVELGSWKGRSTAILSAASDIFGAKVASVDAFIQPPRVKYHPTDIETFYNNLSRLSLLPDVFLLGHTQTVHKEFKEDIGFLFIDSDHREAYVSRDIENWASKVTLGGLVAFHDYGHPKWPGVKLAVDKWLHNNNHIVHKHSDRLLVVEKR